MVATRKPVVDFHPSEQPKAMELFNAAHSGKYWLIICGGAVRGGKSFGVGGVLMTLLKRYPGSRSHVVRDSLQTLRDTTLPTVEKLIPPSFVKQFKGDPQFLWKFTNGSSFQFFSEQDAQDPERRRWNGLETNFIWLEQGEELQEKTFDKAIERAGSYFIPARVGVTPKSVIFVTVNPTEVKWVRKFYDSWKAGTLETDYPGVCYIPMTIDDNGAADLNYKQGLLQLKKTNPIKYKIFVEGDWDVKEKTGDEWFYNFDYDKHVRGPSKRQYDYFDQAGKGWYYGTDGKDFTDSTEVGVPFRPDLPGDVHTALDFNTVPYMTSTNFQLDRIDGRLKVRYFKEYCLASPQNRTDRLCQALIASYLMPYRKTVQYHGDRQGENRVEGMGTYRRFDDLRSTLRPYLHTRSNQVNKSVTVNANTRDFLNDVLAGLLPIDILIDEENCPNLIKDLATTKEGATGIKKEMGKDAAGNRYEKNGHCLSTFVYGILGVPDIYRMYTNWRKQRGLFAEASPNDE